MGKKLKERKPKSVNVNPFDLKYNFKKGAPLDQDGKPVPKGTPRAYTPKAIIKRDKTIGVQFNRLGIVNELKDARVGEQKNWSHEEKAARRYVEVKKRAVGKRKFNLQDDDQQGMEDDMGFLPKGKDLTQVQQFESLDDDGDDDGVDRDVMALANFGGGRLNARIVGEDGRSKKLSRKEIFHEILSKSKEAKLIKQVAKDEVDVMTENLDERFKLIRNAGVLAPFKGVATPAERLPDDYDEIYGTLLFETKRKAQPQLSERMKAEKEVAKLAELEQQRLERMDADDNPSDDEVVVKTKKRKIVKKDEEKTSIVFDHAGKSKVLGMPVVKTVEYSPDEEPDFYGDDLDAEDMDEDGDEEGIEDEIDSDEAAEDEVDNEEDEDESEIEEEEEVDEDIEEEQNDSAELPSVEIAFSSADEKKVAPFVIDIPVTYKAFQRLYLEYSSDQWAAIAERIIKCNHPRLKKGNKKLLGFVFKFALRFFEILGQTKAFDRMQPMTAVLRKYLEVDPVNGAEIVRSLLEHKRKTYLRKSESDIRPTATFDVIAFLALVSELFPTSDAFHPVCTPTLYFAIDVLKMSYIDSLQSVGVTLLLTKILTKWVADSKKYIPELVKTTRMLLELAVTKQDGDFLNDPYAYPNISRKNNTVNVLIPEKQTKMPEGHIQLSSLFGKEPDTNLADLRYLLLQALFQNVHTTMDLYDNLEHSYEAIFGPQLKFLQRINKKLLPAKLNDVLDELVGKLLTRMEQSNPRTQRQRVTIKKVHMVKLLDPVIDEEFEVTNLRRPMRRPCDPAEEEKWMKKRIKREKRGAIKELRLDARYISSAQQKKRQEVKSDRDEKTKRIISQLQGQESEYKKNHFKPKKF